MHLANDGTPGIYGWRLIGTTIYFRHGAFYFPKCTYPIRLGKSVNNKRYMNTQINYRVEDMLGKLHR